MGSSRALVTGASGFIGSLVADTVASEGVEVVPLVRSTSDLRFLEGHRRRLVVGDVSDRKSLESAVRGTRWVLHVAGVVRARGEELYQRVNAEGTRNLLEAVARVGGGVERVVVVSSLAAVGPSPDGTPVDETTEPRPISAYGRSKKRAEEYVRRWSDRVPAVVVRPPAVYGPRDRGILPFFRGARRGFVPCLGGGRKSYSLIHGVDLARGIWRAATHPSAVGRTFFLCDLAVYPWDSIVGGFAEAVGHPVRSVRIPGWFVRAAGAVCERAGAGRRPFLTRDKARELLAHHWVCDARRAREAIGFRCERGLVEGLAETARWYREQGWLGP